MGRQQPKNREKFDAMCRVLSAAETKTELAQMSLMYIMDMSYERADIALALHNIEIERGWH
jgi:hypothetical protein